MLADTAAAEADHPQHLATEFLRPSPRPIWHFRPLRDRQKCPSLALPRLPTICRGRADWAEAPATAPAPVVWQCNVTDPGRISENEASVRRWLCRGLHSGVLHPEPDQRPSWTTRLLLRRKEVCLRHPILHTGKIPVDICRRTRLTFHLSSGRDHGGLSPDHESSAKSEREFSENDADGSAPSNSTSVAMLQPTRTIGPRASATVVAPAAQPPPPPPPSATSLKRREELSESSSRDDDQSPHKRRRRGGNDPLSRRGASGGRGQHGRSPRRTGSDSEDAGGNSDYLGSSVGSNCLNLANFQPRSTRYNFCTDLGN